MIDTPYNYPEGLPAPLWAENASTPVSPNLRTSMESGRARQRKWFASVPTMRQAAWIMTDLQAAFFESWYSVTLKEGTEWFGIDLRTPLGYTRQVCRIVGVYDGPRNFGARRWRITATLEIFERPLIPAEWQVYPDVFLNASLFDRIMNEYWPRA